MRSLRLIAAALVCATALAAAPEARAQGFGGTVTDILVRGDLLFLQNRPNEAIIQFQDARTLCAAPAEIVHALMGEADARSLLKESLPAAGLYEEAVARFPEDPRAPDCLYRAGILRYRAGEVDRAIDLLRQSIDHKPTPDLEPQALFALGQALRARGRHAEVIEALRDFETRFSGHPLLSNVLYTQAMSEHDLGNLDKSEAIYGDILKRFAPPNMNQAFVEAHFEIAVVLAELGRRQEAADYYRKYVGMNPTSPVAAAALERAGDCLLLRSPKVSAELYALARVKAAANPAPPQAALGLSRFIGAKRTAAEALSRVWVTVLIGIAVLAGLALGLRGLLRRRAGA